ncbi:hypothetical protein [Amycolatopsis orientalis]|uniref:hypothetical protein n=1 Tax=Amycolatopsis orientalis TaxID=31958 RepID=UPI00055AC778|nr:hypothetical protein [Amycolatopsis orientalis]
MDKGDELASEFDALIEEIRYLAERVERIRTSETLHQRADYRVRGVALALVDAAGSLQSAAFIQGDWTTGGSDE